MGWGTKRKSGDEACLWAQGFDSAGEQAPANGESMRRAAFWFCSLDPWNIGEKVNIKLIGLVLIIFPSFLERKLHCQPNSQESLSPNPNQEYASRVCIQAYTSRLLCARIRLF